jgi:hypothetical protein
MCDHRWNLYLLEMGLKDCADARWSSGAKPHLKAQYKPLKSRNMAPPPRKHKAKICATMGLILHKETHSAQKYESPIKAVREIVII